MKHREDNRRVPGGYRAHVLGAAYVLFICGTDCCAWSDGTDGGRGFAAVIEGSGDLRDPANRLRVVAEIRMIENARREAAKTRALRLGLPLRGDLPNGGAFELADFEGDQPLYRITCNANAAISTAANLIRVAPYNANGSGGVVGVWDASSARTTHQEFGSRVSTMDGSSATVDHSSHVVGTVCAAGVSSSAKGMAPSVRVDSYDWNSDTSEMTARGASYPVEPGKLNISNHSYGQYAGWGYTATPYYTWNGTGADASGVEDDFGKYETNARTLDSLAYSLPYYLVFWAAGNDRNENPYAGQLVSVGGATVAYDPAAHPPGDGVYRGGYDSMSYHALAKNIVTVGSVSDAVSGGVRYVPYAAMASYSSWGPTDDGRIKPDLVANGLGLYSTYKTSDTAYGTISGTSMASPNAAGTAQLLVHYFGILFTNQTMRASTLKALLIHTADDLGNAGPDYRFGWGLVNAKAAADLLRSYSTNAGTRRVVEDRLVSSTRTAASFSFTWDGASPIRATLCWTDPAGAATAAHDSRTPRLVNNLDLRVTGPAGAVYQPWVMPFVGDWTTNTFASLATAGSNTTDNVEQVLISSPGAPGTYTAHVTFAGTLANGSQPFSLILSGAAGASAALAPVVTASAPASGTGTNLFTLAGDRFMLGADVRLRRAGAPDVRGANVEVLGDTLKSRLYTTGMTNGWWHLVVTNPDGQRAVFYNAFLVGAGVVKTIRAEDFETNSIAAKGWAFQSIVGASQWGLSAAKSVSPTRSLFSAGAETRSDTCAVSPAIAIPAQSSGLTLSFWHDYDFELLKDGGVLEFSLDNGGTWFDVTASGSGAAFSAGGYTDIISSLGKPSDVNPLKDRWAWTGSSVGFAKVTVNLTDAATYAGKTLYVRWRLGTNGSTASAGWYVDDVVLSGVTPPNMTRATLLSVR